MGVVAGSIRFSYFSRVLFERLSLDPEDTITVLRRDRTIMMRRPFDLDIIGKKPRRPAALEARQSQSGRLVCRTGTDRTHTAASMSASSGTNPLFVVAGKAARLGCSRCGRREGASPSAAVILVLALFVLGSAILLARAKIRPAAPRRRKQARGKWRQRNGADGPAQPPQVSTMSSIPKWRRAMRQKTQVALLMIDADHFKAYNDTFRSSGRRPGWLVGHRHLASPIRCAPRRRLRRALWRRGIRRAAAEHLGPPRPLRSAEMIRGKVQGWSDDGAGSTVSCGIASLVPTAGNGLGDPGRRRRTRRSMRRKAGGAATSPWVGKTFPRAVAGGVKAPASSPASATAQILSSFPRSTRSRSLRPLQGRRRCWRGGSRAWSRNHGASPSNSTP